MVRRRDWPAFSYSGSRFAEGSIRGIAIMNNQ